LGKSDTKFVFLYMDLTLLSVQITVIYLLNLIIVVVQIREKVNERVLLLKIIEKMADASDARKLVNWKSEVFVKEDVETL